ncbi:MAG: hypothetical protein ACRERX_20090 [Pseudomonas sp.]
MEKKPYNPPKLTDQGSVIEQTKGLLGYSYEPWGNEIWDEDLKLPPKKPN